MIQNTSLRNINTNKAKQEDLTNQLATGKKISKPSDDPIVAIRSLKLNSTLDKTNQYYKKNAEDAESWLDLTSSAISTVNDVLVTMKKYINQACNSYEEASDREAIITNLQQCVEEIYSTGDSDSGGRSLFTGYRTDMSLTVQADKTEKNTITEQLTNSDIITKTYVSVGKLKELNEGNFNNLNANKGTVVDTDEYDVTTNEVYRIRLAYSDLDANTNNDKVQIGYMTNTELDANDENTVNLSIGDGTDKEDFSVTVDPDTKEISINGSSGYTVSIIDTNNNTVTSVPKGSSGYKLTLTDANGNSKNYLISYSKDGKISITDNNNITPQETVSITATVTKDADGKNQVEFDDKYMTSLAITDNFASYTEDGVYESVIGTANANNITYVADEGELLLGTNIQERLSRLSSDTEIRVTYDKSEWAKGDLDPVHYFYTVRTVTQDGKEKNIEYNENFLDDPTASGKQIIEYDVGNNQTIRVNTTADELFTHDMGRDVDEVVEMLNEYSDLQDSLATVKDLIDSEEYSGDDLTTLETQKAALEKAMTYVGDKINKRCSALLTDCENYAERAQLAETNCGSRGTRLDLIKNRLSVQQTNFEELVSENEDADYTDLAIQLQSIELTYEAALSSISYVMQTTLLDFI
jgi:flagellar hook-associated protein 3 FlgL